MLSVSWDQSQTMRECPSVSIRWATTGSSSHDCTGEEEGEDWHAANVPNQRAYGSIFFMSETLDKFVQGHALQQFVTYLYFDALFLSAHRLSVNVIDVGDVLHGDINLQEAAELDV